MLVLSRKRCQQIVLPNLGVKVEVLRIAGNTVSLGIDAPESVKILRGELNNATSKPETDLTFTHRSAMHALRNKLHQAQLIVALAQRQLSAGSPADAECTLGKMLERLSDLEAGVATIAGPVSDSGAEGTVDGQAPTAIRHALVVEDDANERALLAGYLRLCGFRVSEAEDGVVALEFLKSNTVDLIALDILMPRMNGLETLKAIRQQANLNQAKVVIVSGEDRRKLADVECQPIDKWFTKPLNPAHLVDQLQAMA